MTADVQNEEGRFLLVYGTETGQAKAIAEIIRDKAVEKGLHPVTFCFSQSDKGFQLTSERVLVVVVSTTGDGDPPDTVRRAWRRLRGKSLSSEHLKQLHFALLGLGDTNYDNFCNMGKNLNERFLELGATAFYPPGFADDAVGMENVVEPWISGLWEPLAALLSPGKSPVSEGKTPVPEGKVPNSEEQVPNSEEQVPVPEGKAPVSEGKAPVSEGKAPVSEGKAPGNKLSATREEEKAQVAGDPKEVKAQVAGDPKEVIDTLSAELRKITMIPNVSLYLPALPRSYLWVNLGEEAPQNIFPFASVPHRLGSRVSMATVMGSQQLTNEGALKRTLELTLSVSVDVRYEPGDAVGVVCPAPLSEVRWLLERLSLSSQSQRLVTLSLTEGSKKILPPHVPCPCTLEQLFSHCLNIRAVPKKAFLHLLAEHCTDEGDKQRLKELASREGAVQYTRLITQQRTDLLHVLNSFPSLQPPLETLVENLPRLLPRYYSVTSSPMAQPHILTVAFNVESLPCVEWAPQETRKGLATGWLEQATNQIAVSPLQVPIFTRSQNPFRLPSDPGTPLIMIGPGTGVAPFVGFLRHMAVGGVTQRKAWLFFGCRHPDVDYLYQKELSAFHTSGLLTKLSVTFSRLDSEEGVAKVGVAKVAESGYVQEKLREEWKDVGQWIMERGAAVYMCGDAQTMVKKWQTVVEEVIARYLAAQPTGSSVCAESAEEVVARIREESRLLVDLWT